MGKQRVSQVRREESISGKPATPSVGPGLATAARLHPLTRLQQTIGNRAVQLLLHSRALQAKLTVSQPGDVYEQEAEQVADHVMRAAAPGDVAQNLGTGQPLELAEGGPRCTRKPENPDHPFDSSSGIREGVLYICQCCTMHDFASACEAQGERAWQDCMEDLRKEGFDPNKTSDFIEMTRRCAVARWFVKSFCEWDETQNRGPGECYCTDRTI